MLWFSVTRDFFTWQRLKGELDKLLQIKIKEPEIDIFSEGKGVVVASIELF
jgi:ATP-dependent RNA helicase DHX36